MIEDSARCAAVRAIFRSRGTSGADAGDEHLHAHHAKSATVTLVAAIAFIAVTTVLGLRREPIDHSAPENGWRLRSTLAFVEGAVTTLAGAEAFGARLPAAAKPV